MTTLREAAELALDALEYHTHQTRPIHNTELAIEALRSALEAPAQRIPENCGSGYCSCIECLKPPEPGLFINMIAQHDGLAEELKAPEPGEREALITKLNQQECCQAHGGAGSRVCRCEDCPRTIADMLADDVSKSSHELDKSEGRVDLVNEPGERESMLLHELRYIAGISTGQVKRVADEVLARCADVSNSGADFDTNEQRVDLVGDRKTLIEKMRWACVVGGNEVCGKVADMLEADAPFEPDWVDYKNGFEAGKAEAIPDGYVLAPIWPTLTR